MTISAPHNVAVVDTVAVIVADVLGFDEVGLDEDMFTLGMTSLAAIRIIARVNELFDIELDLLAAFEALTVRKLAELAEAGQAVSAEFH
jgi:acyl carrier protein